MMQIPLIMNTISFKKFIKVPNQSFSNNIFDSLFRTYEGDQQIKEAKVGLLNLTI